MTKHALIAAFHSTSVGLAVASYEAESRLIADFAGRVVHPLDNSVLWSAASEESDALPLSVRVQLVQRLLQHREGTLDDWLAVRGAVKSLLQGIKAFAEARLELDLEILAVVLPYFSVPTSRQLFESCAFEVGFMEFEYVRQPRAAMKAYDLYTRNGKANVMVINVGTARVEASIFSAGTLRTTSAHGLESRVDLASSVQLAVQLATQTVGDPIDHVIFVGDIDADEASSLFQDTLFEQLSSATFQNTIEPRKVCAYGMISHMRDLLGPQEPSGLLMCLIPNLFDISIEVAGGVSEPLAVRLYTLPTVKTTRIRVFSDHDDGTVELRFCEGQRANFQENWLLGVLPIHRLSVGWNELQVRLDMTPEYRIRIDVSAVSDAGLLPRGQLAVTSACIDMTFDDTMAYFDDFERATSREDETKWRQQHETRSCTEALVATVLTLEGLRVPRSIRSQHGDVGVIKFHVIESAQREARADTPLVAELVRQLEDRSGVDEATRSEQRRHDAALLALGDRIHWRSRSLDDRCKHCVAFHDARSSAT